MDLEIITVFFNPCKYKRRIDKYWMFREEVGYPVTTIELSFDGKFEIPDAVHVPGNRKNIMWQKERLINLALERSSCKKFAWVDCDLIFESDGWAEKASKILDDFPICQLYSNIGFIDRQGEKFDQRISWAANKLMSKPLKRATPGGAWAANREVFPFLPFDYNIVGGGDDFLVRALYGEHEKLRRIRPVTDAMWSIYSGEARMISSIVQGRVGVLNQSTVHLYHGEREGRQHGTRYETLLRWKFDPFEDIRIGENGVWEWSSEKPGLHHEIERYFRNRREDAGMFLNA